jgi:hypothetical protein
VIKWKLDFPCLPVGQWHDNLQCTEKGKQDVRKSFIKEHLDSRMHLCTYYCEKGCNGVRDIPPLKEPNERHISAPTMIRAPPLAHGGILAMIGAKKMERKK